MNDYDSFAEDYAAHNESGVQNASYERPAMLSLAGEVSGRRILDAGCGVGFQLRQISEPQPDPAARELFPEDFEGLSTQLGFLFFVLQAPPAPG